MLRVPRHLLISALAPAALALPVAARAGDGGATIGAAPAPPPASSPGGLSLDAPRETLAGRRLAFHGTAPRRAAGRRVRIERRERSGWRLVGRATVGRRGGYAARTTPTAHGRRRYRALLEGASAASRHPEISVAVFAPARATWYGPGLYGNRTACGQTLAEDTLGVAHRTLPCGARVRVLHRGRSLALPVIDRGPFGAGADWDLTAAAAKRLGLTGTSTVGVLRAR